MTKNRQSLNFSIKESVWFERGQELENVISMSLDPDIVIQEHDNYISIRGALLLNGEYYPKEEQSEEEAVYSLRENPSVRTVDEVTERENGSFEINHKFPIDITIPMNRVENLDDVYVLVESFDYEIPKSGYLQLSAELSISGIVGDRQEKEVQEKRNIPSSFESPTVEAPVPEAKQKVESQEEVNEKWSSAEEVSFPSFELEAKKQTERKEDQEEINVNENDNDRDKFEETFDMVTDEVEEVVEEFKEEEEVDKTPQIEMKGRVEQEKLYTSFKNEQKKEEEEVEEPYKIRDENALYLTNILSGNEADEFSKVRMRIVQQGESLDTIASSYEVSMHKLLQMNDLEDEHVEEGEIVYIPVTQNQ